MTPEAIFRRVVERNAPLHARYKNPAILPLDARPVLRGVYQLVGSSAEHGVFRPDPEMDGETALPDLVARAIDAVGAEDEVSDSLARLARLGFFTITTSNCIVVNLPARRPGASQAAKPASKAEANRQNGARGGRPRAGESADAAYQRRLGQGSLMLPLGGGTGPSPYGDPLLGEELAQQLRSQLRLADPPQTETQPQTQTETQTETQTPQTETQTGLPPVSPQASPLTEEEEERSKSTTKEEAESAHNLLPPPPPHAGAGDEKPKTETQPAKPKTQNPTDLLPPLSPISNEAAALAERATRRWSWSPQVAKAGPRIFQDLLDSKWTAQQISREIDHGAAAKGPGFYRAALPKRFGRPGDRLPMTPAPIADQSGYPDELGGAWTARLKQVRAQIDRVLGENARHWLGEMRFTALEDGELTLWFPRQFTRDYANTHLRVSLEAVIARACPEVRRIVLTCHATRLARTG